MPFLNGDACRVILSDGTPAAVFFDEEWDAWAYSSDDLTNGPYGTIQESAEALIEDVGAYRIPPRVMRELTHLREAP